MNCKLTCFVLLVLFSTKCLAQTEDVTNVAKVTLLNPGVSYEARIGKYQTVHAQLFMNTSAYGATDAFGNIDYDFYFDPAATLQYRYYYNAQKRLERDKRIDKNSMNYLAGVTEVFLSKMPLTQGAQLEQDRRAVWRFGAVWGLQRNFEKHFSLDLNLGLGYLSSKETIYGRTFQPQTVNVGQATFLGQFNIGFWF